MTADHVEDQEEEDAVSDGAACNELFATDPLVSNWFDVGHWCAQKPRHQLEISAAHALMSSAVHCTPGSAIWRSARIFPSTAKSG